MTGSKYKPGVNRSVSSSIVRRIFFIVLAFSAVFSTWATDAEKVESVPNASFFQRDSGLVFEALKPYAAMPGEAEALPIEHYERIAGIFDWWLKKALKPQYVPDLTFTKENIRLIPAAGNTSKKDLAFLSYRIQNKTFMIVQTGGVDAHMLIFLHDPETDTTNDIAQAHNRIHDFQRKYINHGIWKYIPALEMKEEKGGIAATAIPTQESKIINHAKLFMEGNETCLFIQKVYFEDTRPGREPMQDQWFEFWKGEKLNP